VLTGFDIEIERAIARVMGVKPKSPVTLAGAGDTE
jgi:hypothetical protein